MRLLVLGNGASGRAAAALAARLGHETATLEGDDALPAHFAKMRPRGKMSFDGAIISPGIPLDHPWQAACRAAGIPVKSELQFGCEELRRRGVRLLAVTGSKGKSSVVKLVADALTRAGRRAVPCGNYGRPVCDVALEVGEREDTSPFCACPRAQQREGNLSAARASGDRRTTESQRTPWVAEAQRITWAVVEVSSFQLETTELAADTFEAAAILNLQEDHLDRHGSVAVYHALKRRLLGMTKRPFDCSARGDRALPAGSESGARGRPCGELFAGSYFDNEILRPNGAAAVFLLRAAGLDDAAVASAFAAFEPLPHRMNTVGIFGGVTCIDDSKATSLAALAAGVRMASSSSRVSRLASPDSRFASRVSRLASDPSRLASRDFRPPSRPIRLIAGGLPKGDDPRTVLADLTARVKKVYLIGTSAESFSSAWSGAVACEICGTLDRAVKTAMREAESGETILLSPGTASFDQFKSFGERGDVFADLIHKEGKYK